jgi:hypothetical protein
MLSPVSVTGALRPTTCDRASRRPSHASGDGCISQGWSQNADRHSTGRRKERHGEDLFRTFRCETTYWITDDESYDDSEDESSDEEEYDDLPESFTDVDRLKVRGSGFKLHQLSSDSPL